MAKFIPVTEVYQELTEAAEQKLEEVHNRVQEKANELGKELEDENGNNAEWYENMGIPVPKELLATESKDGILYEESVDLTEEDYVTIEKPTLCNTDKVLQFGEVDTGTFIMYSKDSGLIVKETLQEITELLAQL